METIFFLEKFRDWVFFLFLYRPDGYLNLFRFCFRRDTLLNFEKCPSLTDFDSGGHGDFGLVRVGVGIVERHVVPEHTPLVDGVQVTRTGGRGNDGDGARQKLQGRDHCHAAETGKMMGGKKKQK